MVADIAAIDGIVDMSRTRGVRPELIEEPMVYQPGGTGTQGDEPALSDRIDEVARGAGAPGGLGAGPASRTAR